MPIPPERILPPFVPLPHDAVAAVPWLQLNNAHAVETSELTPATFGALVRSALLAVGLEPAAALLIAMDQDASYGSPNFQWFRKRYSRFVYIDRVIVGTAFRRQGLAQALYAHLFETARAAGQTRVVCEVNAEPANPVSDAFHAALGFQPVGLAALPNGKTVRYLERLG